MILKLVKEQMLLPRQEYIINQWANIRGMDVLLLSFTIEKDKSALWIMYINDELDLESSAPSEHIEGYRTNRQKLLQSIERTRKDKYIHIKRMAIQGQTVTFDSSSCSPVYESNIEGIMRLQHFAEKGLLPEEWDNVDLRNIFIAKYEQREDESVPHIDTTEDLSVALHIDRSSLEIPIQYSFEMNFGKQPIGTKFTYYDDELKKEYCFYVDEIYSYDIYEEILKGTRNIEDKKMRKKMLKHFIRAMKNLCPIGKNMAVIKYETEDNTQLRFMTKNYLEAEPVHSNTGVSIGFISGNGLGINGYKVRECMLHPVDKDFSGKLELELFSRLIEIPEETVRCCSRTK